jgi:hypothetical protein
MARISGKLNLAALTHIKRKMKNKEGEEFDLLIIPIQKNNLFQGKEGAVYIDIIGFEMKEPKEYATHIVKQSFSKKDREKMPKEQLDNLPILGNLNELKDTFNETNNSADSNDNENFDDIDDLPF